MTTNDDDYAARIERYRDEDPVGGLSISQLRQQVAAQYQVVAHLATALTEIHNTLVDDIQSGDADELLEIRGERSHQIMNTLGDILNNMDAGTPDDEWTYPIFREAHRLWRR